MALFNIWPIRFLFCLIAMSESYQAHAFEQDGFRSGMSPAEAIAVIRSSRQVYDPMDHDTDSPMSSILFGRQSTSIGIGGSVVFCSNRLIGVTKRIPGGFLGFSEYLSDLIASNGKGDFSTYVRPGPEGNSFRLQVYWEEKPETQALIIDEGERQAVSVNFIIRDAFGTACAKS